MIDLINSDTTDVLTGKKYVELEYYCKALGYECERSSCLSVIVKKDDVQGKVYQKRGTLIFSSDNGDEDISRYIQYLNKIKRLTPIATNAKRDIISLFCGILQLEKL